MLQETVGRALKLSQEAAARMEELQIQLSVLQRQCTYRDRPLCDTLRIRSFEENGVVDALKTVSTAKSEINLLVLHVCTFRSSLFVSCKRTRASFACATWEKLNSGPPSRI